MRFTNVNLLQGLLSDNCSNYVTLNCFKTAHTLLNRTKKKMILGHRNTISMALALEEIFPKAADML